MTTQLIKPRAHGIIDYVFSGLQFVLPSVLKLNKEFSSTYKALATGFLAVNAATATSVGAKPILTLYGHKRLDQAFLAGLSLLTLAPMIRHDKKALAFHLGFLALAIGNYVLSDYEEEEEVVRRRRRW